MNDMGYDALILVSFGGPEGPDDVLPFLRNVVRGRGVPDERLVEVAHHYDHFGGVSPINAQCRELLAALRPELATAGVDLPLYWGNRNWDPYLADTVARMRDDGVQRALAFVTSPFGSYSSCRQYLDDIEAARAQVGAGAPAIDKIRHYHDHPGYVRTFADAVRAALRELSDVDPVRLVFTAHSIPSTMERHSGPHGGRYSAQLRETATLVANDGAPGVDWDLVWQSRSGPPQVPWLEPDINDHLAALAEAGVRGVVVCPIGFISDHLEVAWDLDTEAAQTAKGLNLAFVRAATPGIDHRFVSTVRDLIMERLDPAAPRARLGELPMWDTCPPNCCRPPAANHDASARESAASQR
jgi:protoporphyrin/coproporphyrin ferrochelatase